MKQLLLADDEPMLLTSMLEIDWAAIGIDHVYTAGSGIEAVEVLKSQMIDIVLTDIRMPGMGGIEVCDYVREHCPRTKCIILSGYSDFTYAQEAIRTKAFDYLIKPIKDDKLMVAVSQALEVIAKEWEAVSSMERARQTLHQQLPLTRSNLLNDLLSGKPYSEQALIEKLQTYELPHKAGDRFYMCMIRLEQWYLESDDAELGLFEFSVVNIVEELMREDFELWTCRDGLGYLICLLMPKDQEKDVDPLLDKLSNEVQSCVKSYLNGEISMLVGYQDRLSSQVTASVYQTMLNRFRKLPRSSHGFFMQVQEETSQQVVSLQRLYSPPTLKQLLEVGRYDDAREQINAVFLEMLTEKLDDEEHVLEVTTSFYSAFSYIAHLKGMSIVDLGETGMNIDQVFFRGSFAQIRDGFLLLMDRLETLSAQETKEVHAQLKMKVHQFIEDHISYDISLQAIGDYVGLHPAYLSSVYKQVTGGNISDYVYQFRMEKARFQLRSSDMKIYELSQQLGFQNAPYFSKLFKQHHGLTPQEYRDRVKT